MPAQELSIGNG